MSCREARAAILATFREQATEAARLRLDEHLAGCQACREERGRWALMESLRTEPSTVLAPAARTRILRSITAQPMSRTMGARQSRRIWPALAIGAAMAIGAGVVMTRLRPTPPSSESVHATAGASEVTQTNASASSATERPDGLRAAAADGIAQLAGARVAYRTGTIWRVSADDRQVDLVAGEVDVDVAPGGPGRFRVVTPGFIVEVIGTHFVVRLDGVRTLHGVVRVLDVGGGQLALLRSGESWQRPIRNAAAAAAIEPVAPSSPRTVARAAAPTRAAGRAVAVPKETRQRHLQSDESRLAAVAAAPPLSAAQLLSEARGVLGTGDTVRARLRIADAMAANPNLRQRAMGELLSADALLVESRHDLALAAYRRTAEAFASLPEGETAAFAAAQLLTERSRRNEARAALEAYLNRYPSGRFAREAREKLAAATQP